MRGIERIEPGSIASRVGVGRARALRSLTGIALLAGVTAALAVPAAARGFTFPETTTLGVNSSPQAIVADDFNGDSDPDLAIVNEFSHNISIVLGGPGGSFGSKVDYAVGERPLAIASGKFNGDSDPDLAVVNERTNNLSVFLGGPGGSFSGPTNFPTGSIPQSVAVGDFDGDSDSDLATANELSNDVSVLRGDGGGSFSLSPATFPVGSSPRSIVAADFNGDSDPDLAVANELWNSVSVLLGSSAETFAPATNYGVGAAPTAITAGEFNGDSDPDLAVANELSHTVSVLLGGSGGSFTGPTDFAAGTLPDNVAVADFNADSDSELAVANQSSDDFSLLFGHVDGSFTEPSNFAAGDGPTAIAIDDFDGDSEPDLAVTNEFANSVSIHLGANLPAESSPAPAHDHPRSAAQVRVALVPALRETISSTQCQARGGKFSTHGAPLAFDSCNPPAYRPGTAARLGPVSNSSALLTAVYGDTNAGNGDQANLRMRASLNDVRTPSGGDYAPSASGPDLTLVAAVRLSDTYTGPALDESGTLANIEFDAPVNCAPMAGSEGSRCAVDTTAEALTPGAIRENESSVLQILKVKVEDSGLNGVRGDSDDMAFATQGLYIP